MLPYKVQKIVLLGIAISLLMLALLFLENLEVLNIFGVLTSTLVIVFSILIYIFIFLAVISKEREEDSVTKYVRFRVASRIFLLFFAILLCFKILENIFIYQDITEIFPITLLTSGKSILLFFIAYFAILKVSIKRCKRK